MRSRSTRRKVRPQNKEVLESVLEHIGNHCSKCGHDRSTSDLTILGKMNNVMMIHIGCKACGSQDVFHFVANVGYSTAGGIVTDVSPEEAHIFLQSSSVSRDDLLDIYLILRDTDSCAEFVGKISERRHLSDRKIIKSPVPSGPPVSTAVLA